jgi:hypothetical protein
MVDIHKSPTENHILDLTCDLSELFLEIMTSLNKDDIPLDEDVRNRVTLYQQLNEWGKHALIKEQYREEDLREYYYLR